MAAARRAGSEDRSIPDDGGVPLLRLEVEHDEVVVAQPARGRHLGIGFQLQARCAVEALPHQELLKALRRDRYHDAQAADSRIALHQLHGGRELAPLVARHALAGLEHAGAGAQGVGVDDHALAHPVRGGLDQLAKTHVVEMVELAPFDDEGAGGHRNADHQGRDREAQIERLQIGEQQRRDSQDREEGLHVEQPVVPCRFHERADAGRGDDRQRDGDGDDAPGGAAQPEPVAGQDDNRKGQEHCDRGAAAGTAD